MEVWKMSEEHAIESLMSTTMRNLRDMVDVNTIVGDIIESSSGVAVIPVSKVSCGFVAGGGNPGKEKERIRERDGGQPLFAGGGGAGISINPIAFLVMCGENVRLIPISGATPLDKAIEAVPVVAEQLQHLLNSRRREVSNSVEIDTAK